MYDTESSELSTITVTRRQVTSAIAKAILDAATFHEDLTLVMDYACGSGALSQRLAPYSKAIIGIDIDPIAVNRYNNNVANQGIPSEEMQAICVDLHEQTGELKDQLFDVIVCSQAYHHFPSINATTRLLSSFLKPHTGTLFVSDLLKGPHTHEFREHCDHTHHHHTVVHRGGLTESEVRDSFEKAGLVDIDFEIVEVVRRSGREVKIFLAQGVKPADKV